MDFKQENDFDHTDYTPIKNKFFDPERPRPIASAPIASAPKSTPPATHEHMCEILIETYNTSIIDYFSEELQDFHNC